MVDETNDASIRKLVLVSSMKTTSQKGRTEEMANGDTRGAGTKEKTRWPFSGI